MSVRALFLSVLFLTLLMSGRARALTKTWAGSDGGSYSTPGNWNQNGMPGTADSIVFANGSVASPYDINFDVDATVTQLIVATNPLVFAGSTRTLSLTSTSTVDSSRAMIIGRTGTGTGNAALSTSLAQLNTTYAVLGLDTGTTGTLNVTAGTFNVSGTAAFSDLLIGDSGTGTINVSGGAHVTVAGDTDLATFGASVGNISVTGSGSTWTNTGAVGFLKGTGTITVADGGALSAAGGLFLSFSPSQLLTGNGDVTAAVSNSGGTVAPGATLGTLHIAGTYTQSSAGKLQIQLGGTTAGTQYDRLWVSGNATLAGTLQVTLSSFMPAEGDVFDILDFTSRTGIFSTVTLPPLSGSLQWDTSKLYTDGTIAVVLPGDFNRNGGVDVADYTSWRKGVGTTYVANDYTLWRTNFAKTASAASPTLASVPEPTTALLLCIAGLITTCRIRAKATTSGR
jgi:T5SS/PEP-CTERM-associated repeat protein